MYNIRILYNFFIVQLDVKLGFLTNLPACPHDFTQAISEGGYAIIR